jgi:hypothetical protein
MFQMSLLAPIALMMEAASTSETLVVARVTLCHNPEDSRLYTVRRENFRQYNCVQPLQPDIRPYLTHDAKNIGPQRKTSSVSLVGENAEMWPNSVLQNAMWSYVLIPTSACTAPYCPMKTVWHYSGGSGTLKCVLKLCH